MAINMQAAAGVLVMAASLGSMLVDNECDRASRGPLAAEPDVFMANASVIACGADKVAYSFGRALSVWNVAKNELEARQYAEEGAEIVGLAYDPTSNAIVMVVRSTTQEVVCYNLSTGALERAVPIEWDETTTPIGVRRSDGALVVARHKGVQVIEGGSGRSLLVRAWPEGAQVVPGSAELLNGKAYIAVRTNDVADLVRWKRYSIVIDGGAGACPAWVEVDSILLPPGDPPALIEWSPGENWAVGYRELQGAYVEIGEVGGGAVQRIGMDYWGPVVGAVEPGGQLLLLAGPGQWYQGKRVSGALRLIDLATGEELVTTDPLRGSMEAGVAIGEDVVFLGNDAALTLDRRENTFMLSRRSLEDLSPERSVPIESGNAQIYLAATLEGDKVLVAWRGLMAELRDADSLEVIHRWSLELPDRVRSEIYAVDAAGDALMGGDDGWIWTCSRGKLLPERYVQMPHHLQPPISLAATNSGVVVWARRIANGGCGPIEVWRHGEAGNGWQVVGEIPGGESFAVACDPGGKQYVRFDREGTSGQLVCWRPGDGGVVWREPIADGAVTVGEVIGEILYVDRYEPMRLDPLWIDSGLSANSSR